MGKRRKAESGGGPFLQALGARSKSRSFQVKPFCPKICPNGLSGGFRFSCTSEPRRSYKSLDACAELDRERPLRLLDFAEDVAYLVQEVRSGDDAD